MITNFARVYEMFFKPGEVTEIRAYGLSRQNKAWEGWAGGTGIVFGYFDNGKDFAKAAEALEKAKAHGIYYTLNPVLPDLLARASNRLKAADGKTPSTADKDILFIRWIPIDLDPIRPAGISSTNEELAEAIKLRDRLAKWLQAKGWKHPIKAVSGNGAHLVYRLKDHEIQDRQNIAEDPVVIKIKMALHGIHKKASSTKVEIDTKVFNPSRIWKLYGTTARKGDSTATRPHRQSYIED